MLNYLPSYTNLLNLPSECQSASQPFTQQRISNGSNFHKFGDILNAAQMHFWK